MTLPDLVCVDPDQVHLIWPKVARLIQTAMERTELGEFEDIEVDVLSGDQLLWLAWSGEVEAAATTRLVMIGLKKVLEITACAGHHRERWLPLFKQIERYGKEEGCARIRIYGRKGWERVLDGYRVEHVILEKDLIHGWH